MENYKVLIALFVYVLLWIPLNGTYWQCGVDICTVGVHFCDDYKRICYKCEDFQSSCWTRDHKPNCTTWCKDNLMETQKQQLIEKTCGPLPMLQNGVFNSTNTTIHGRDEEVTFMCNPGFERVGPESITCNGFNQWSSFPPICQGAAADTVNNFTIFLTVMCVFLFFFVVGETVALILICRKNLELQKQIPKTAEEMPLCGVTEADPGNKAEPISITVDEIIPHSVSQEDIDETARKGLEPSAPSVPIAPSTSSANTDVSERPETNPQAPVFNNHIDLTVINNISRGTNDVTVTGEKKTIKPEPKDTTHAIQETGSKPGNKSAEKPLAPRGSELCQPVDDGLGEKGLSPELPFGGKELSRQLSNHQKEEQNGPNKIALDAQVIDHQDLGDNRN